MKLDNWCEKDMRAFIIESDDLSPRKVRGGVELIVFGRQMIYAYYLRELWVYGLSTKGSKISNSKINQNSSTYNVYTHHHSEVEYHS